MHTAVVVIAEPIMMARSDHCMPTKIQQTPAIAYMICPSVVNPADITNTPSTARIVADHLTYQSGVPTGVVGLADSYCSCNSVSSPTSRRFSSASSIASLPALDMVDDSYLSLVSFVSSDSAFTCSFS